MIHQSQITSSEQADRRILADALADLEKRRVSSTAHPGVWRIVMHSKAIQFAAAAVVVLAVLLGLQFVGTSGVTFAQAIQPILSANTAILDIVVGVEDPNTPVIRDMIVGSRIRRTVDNIEGSVSIIDLESSRILSLTEKTKEAVYVDLKGLPSIPNYLDHLKNVFIKLQDSPHFEIQGLGTKQIDGRAAVGFLARHPNAEITLWADAKTGLPVRIEQKEGRMLVICKNLQFDVPMDEALFSMEVPKGYSEQKMEMDLFGSTEADFIEGLRIRAEIFGDGRFPDGVGVEDFMRSIEAMQGKGEKLGLPKEQEAELGMKMNRHLLFIRFFRGEGKWYYRGQGVQLGEAEAPIFWYRPKDSASYRVIYGDLHVEDVAPENLPEPLDPDDVAEVTIGYQQWSKPDFVGTQEDYWMILPEGKARVKAYVTLLKGPTGVSSMPVALPYPSAPLEAVLLDREPLTFQQTGEGTYNVELPLDKLAAGPVKLLFQWHVSLSDLPREGDTIKTVLKSLIPVTSYALKVGVDPGSSFELTKEPEGLWVTPFTGGAPKGPVTTFGSCGLMIRARQ
ncbi:MAG TPA: hypothetical protein PKH24_14405 [Sedimentisphaerales bacterium]|nr:hypothetical protein [Sedimentisphaerales bacterium]HNU29808.1 hypothetical protein [Sedimentisphaerales bacterium]